MKVQFNKPFLTGKELEYIRRAHERSHLSGDGIFTRKCHAWLEKEIGCNRALLTHSCTGALEMAAILANIGPGDEVLMPSYTFVSTANAFALRGATPVFVDIHPETLTLDESKIEQAISCNTRAIVPVHYAGVACKMDTIMSIAEKHELIVIEDAAQAIESSYEGQPLGSIGDLATLSFHETKNIISGEGGALLINDPELCERAEIIREKGTNRSQFFRGQVDKYTWVDFGSSYLPSELVAAFLWAQMEETKTITQRRMDIWNTYHAAFEHLELQGKIRRPIIPPECTHNAHMYYLLLQDLNSREAFISNLEKAGIHAVFHYVPLHSSPMGKRIGKCNGELPMTDELSGRLVRLPLWLGLEKQLSSIINSILDVLS